MLRRFSLAILASCLWAGSVPAAESDRAATAPDPRALRAAVIAAAGGDAADQQAIRSYLLGGGGPSGVANRARLLIDELSQRDEVAGDAARLQQAMSLVADTAEESLAAPPVARVVVANNFRLADRAVGFDFGSPDSSVMVGFEKVTAKDPRVSGSRVKALRRPSGDSLLADGIADMHRFETELPNGKYRVVLLTDDLGEGLRTQTPFGAQVGVNGNPVQMAATSPDLWLDQAVLGSTGSGIASAGRSGMVIVEAEVADGKLVVEFGSGRTYVSGLIVEPADGDSTLELTGQSERHYETPRQDRQAAQDEVFAAAAERLAEVVTAAGPAQTASVANQTQPAIATQQQISPN